MAKKDKKVPQSALPANASRIPIKNSEEEHSFVISLIYFEDEGPVCRWSDDGRSLFEVLEYLGKMQRDAKATTGDNRDHYQTNKGKLVQAALDWIEAHPAVSRLDEYLWAYRLSGTHRIWGILTDNVFYLLWNDPKHAIYPIDIQNRGEGKKR